MRSPAARAVGFVGATTILLIAAVASLFVLGYLSNRRASQHNGVVIAKVDRESARQDAQFKRAIYIICLKLGETPRSCKAFAHGLLLPKDFDALAIERAGRVEKLVGPQGLRGLPGLSQIIFRAGLNGSQGSRGVPGLRGPAGPPGPQGARGPQGLVGSRGQAGADGKTGAAGARGPQGPPGARGSTGPAGARGPTGPPGCWPPPKCRSEEP